MLIACATDRYYVEMTGVLIRSICAQPHGRRLRFFVFCSGVSRNDKQNIAACVFGDAEIAFVDIPEALQDEIRDFPVSRHLSVTAYVSIYIPKLLRNEGSRVLYVDCDVVVNTSLDPLFAIDLEGRSIAAASDTTPLHRLKLYNEAIGHAADAAYFNSGLFIVNMETWNARQVTERGSAYAATRKLPILQHDQAVLNKVLANDWRWLDPSWNEKPTHLTPAAARTMPILHFRGRMKPFHAEYPHAYRDVYDLHRMQTPWAHARRMGKFERSLQKRQRDWIDRWRRLRSTLSPKPVETRT